jgi:hypothetical protein
MNWETYAALTGIVLTFIVGLINIIIALKKSNKNIFINTITIARKEYLNTLRESVAEFSSIALNENQKNTEKLIKSSCQLKMLMNPAGYIGCWDDNAIELIDKIVQLDNKDKKSDIEIFMALMQSWLALEWHGMTNEGGRGILNKKQKNNLQEKFYSEYQKYLKYKNLPK